jgi:hypothetical protein
LKKGVNRPVQGRVVPRELQLFPLLNSKEITMNKLIAAIIAATFSIGAFAADAAPAAATSASAPAAAEKPAKKATKKATKKAKAAKKAASAA